MMPLFQQLKAVYTFLALAPLASANGVSPGQIKNFVTFGDSYTDVVSTGDRGQAWPVYAAGYGNFTLYPFAKSGATCSNTLTYRPAPSVLESQIPSYLEKTAIGIFAPNPEETMYTLWIGTNDLGANALITGSDGPDVSIVDVRQCAIDWVKVMYAHGARNFVVQNIIPLDLTVLYSRDSYPNVYWDLQRNTVEWNIFMTELVRAGNAITLLMLEALAPILPHAHIASFDSYGLFTDMHNNPHNYLNGTAPLNVTGCIDSCIYALNDNTSPDCTVAEGTARDSFLWYDELHPSEQSDRIVAREMAAVMKGEFSKWVTWLS